MSIRKGRCLLFLWLWVILVLSLIMHGYRVHMFLSCGITVTKSSSEVDILWNYVPQRNITTWLLATRLVP